MNPASYVIFFFLSGSGLAGNYNQLNCDVSTIYALQKERGLPSEAIDDEALKSKHVDKFSESVKYEIINKIPHSKNSFTQGLSYHQGFLFESTGLLGRSQVRKIDAETGSTVQKKKIPADYFGEGLTVLNKNLYQFTLKKNIIRVYETEKLKLLKQLRYPHSAWGSVALDSKLVVGDGSSILKWFDPEKQEIVKAKKVQVNNIPLTGINEMELVGNKIFANIWPTDCIAIIETQNFQVVGWLDLTELYPVELRNHHSDILNGIAFQQDKQILHVTGKNWPHIFQLNLIGKY